jgi:hypothetical protein
MTKSIRDVARKAAWVFRTFGFKAGVRYVWHRATNYVRYLFVHREKLPRCSECGGQVKLIAAPGRTRLMKRGLIAPIPATFAIPTCVMCGEEYMIPEVSDVLDEMLMERAPSEQERTLH